MITKEQAADIIAELSFGRISELVLQQAQEEAERSKSGNNLFSLVFHQMWAEICMSN